ncbi:MAG: hypothetical protein R3D52_03785 [Xanthobacteraceae bacterium]
MTPHAFIHKWKPVTLTERASAQEHFIDLCRLLDHPTPAEDDPTGERFAFEKGVTKTGGGEGFADVWKRGFFAWEYKKKKRDLNAALDQLVRYAAALENPPLQVACDTDRFLIRTAWTNAVPKTYELSLNDLAEPRNLDTLRWVFFDPEKLRPKETRAAVTREAADKFSTIALRLQGRDAPENVAHFVNQLVFCFFAHSVKLPPGFFQNYCGAARKAGEFQALFRRLVLLQWGTAASSTSPRSLISMAGCSTAKRARSPGSGDIGLLRSSRRPRLEPDRSDHFGALFERFLDPDKRGQIEAHYTDPDKIMMIVEPVHPAAPARGWAAARSGSKTAARQAKPPMRAKTKSGA